MYLRGILIFFALACWCTGGCFFAEPCRAAPESSLAVSPVGVQEQPEPDWLAVAPGFELASIALPDTSAVLVCVRMEPEMVRFSLHTSSEYATAPVSIETWMSRHALQAAINASMYLPDRQTSTGYLRSGRHENNSRITAKLGAFFVAEPYADTAESVGLPRAAILDKSADTYENLLPRYAVVVQNFRLFNRDREILWPKEASSAHSIAAVGQDGQGRIYFFHCAAPMTVYAFTRVLLDLPLDLRAAMYVEGGSDAQLGLRVRGTPRYWTGRSSLLGATGMLLPLPNILGAQLREAQ